VITFRNNLSRAGVLGGMTYIPLVLITLSAVVSLPPMLMQWWRRLFKMKVLERSNGGPLRRSFVTSMSQVVFAKGFKFFGTVCVCTGVAVRW